MREPPPFGTTAWLGLIAVLALAVGTRVGYLMTCCEGGASMPNLAVQGQGPRLDFDPGVQLGSQAPADPTEFDNLVANLREHRWFGSLAPLADKEEQTAHVAPGYFWLASFFPSDSDLRRAQTGLSVLAVVCLFFFVRLAFASDIVAIIVGILAALHPFWIINLAELADGTLITCLLAASLMLGAIASRTGGPLASVLFGLSLAGLALVRAVFLPFSFLALAWFLFRCRGLRLGWFAGLLAVLGFGNGLAPWMVRNSAAFHETVPIADSAYLHLWIGNCPKATGGAFDETTLRASLPPERVRELLAESNQAKRYASLGTDVVKAVRKDPTNAARLRLSAMASFLTGEAFRERGTLIAMGQADDDLPPIVRTWVPLAANVALGGFLILAFFGWRFSERWSADCRLATLALIWIPIPYILSHAETLSGPRLPWDAPLIVFAGFAVAWLFPAVRNQQLTVPQLKQAIQEAATRRM